MPKDVFLSHSTKDEKIAGIVCESLEQRGVSCWIAPRDVPPGSNFDEQITAAIAGAPATILLLSKDSNNSRFVRNEVSYALDREKATFVFRLEDVALEGPLGLYLGRSQSIDGFKAPVEEKIDSLAGAILALLGRKPGTISNASATFGRSHGSATSDDLQKEAIKILRSLSEQDLRQGVIISFWEAKGWSVYGMGKAWHGCDVFVSSAHGEGTFQGIQLNENKNVVTREDVEGIRLSAQEALAMAVGSKDGERIAKYYWITTGFVELEGRQAILDILEAHGSTRGRVEVWSVYDLYRQLYDSGAMRTIMPLKIIYAISQIRKHKQDEGVFAAHWCYRALRLYLQQNPVDVPKALACMEAGQAALEADKRLAVHHHRVLRRLFSTWTALLRDRPKLFQYPIGTLESFFERESVAEALIGISASRPELRSLLQDYDRIFSQLVVLEEKFVNTQVGLSTLQICRLLLRAGFPPSEPRIDGRLRRLHEEELGKELGQSMDSECSLCTGTALSCLALARQFPAAEPIVSWITGLGKERYAFRRSRTYDNEPDKNALHYTATVLLGLLDYEGVPGASRIEPVLEFFFQSDDKDSRDFYQDWVRYSNIDRFENSRYILYTFLRLLLTGKELSPARRERLVFAIRSLFRLLETDCLDLRRLYLFYPARTNLSSLVLGRLLEVKEVSGLISEVTELLQKQAMNAAKGGRDLWDSNVDRTAILVEGYLDYWEALLAIAEREPSSGRPVEVL